MNIPPLEQIGFGPGSHRLVFRLLGSLYCEGGETIEEAASDLGRFQRAWVVSATYLHALPYLFVLAVLGRLLLFRLLGLPAGHPMSLSVHLAAVASGVALGLVGAVAWGLALDLSLGIGLGLAVGLAGSLAGGLAAGPVGAFTVALVGTLIVGVATNLAEDLPEALVVAIIIPPVVGIVVGLAVGVNVRGAVFADLSDDLGLAARDAMSFDMGFAAGLGTGIAAWFGSTVGWTTGVSRCCYLPWHLFMLWFRPVSTFRRWHPVFWDHVCWMPFPDLDSLLIQYGEAVPEDGRMQIERLITERPIYRQAALWALTVLLGRESGRIASLAELDVSLGQLPEGDKGFLTQTRDVREKALAISLGQRYVDETDRPYFKEQAVVALRAEINAFYAQVATYREPLASEFRRAAEAWLRLADEQLERVRERRGREPTPQVFRAGDPVQRDKEAFVARLDVVGRVEGEVMAGTGCPGILLYGRRRVGKSTVIRNLEGFLPEAVMPVTISMQHPAAFGSEGSLAGLLAGEIRRAWAGAGKIGPEPADLKTLFAFLQRCNEALEGAGRRLVLCIDEFEGIDAKIGEGVFSRDLPAVLRESIQSHRRITWVFAGSHHFSELANVQWSSYLVSARTIEVTPFTPGQTRLLLTEPLKHSRRGAQTQEAARLFGVEFWGDDGIERIHGEAGGWPHLVQLLASSVVDVCNDRGKGRADGEVLDEAIGRAVVSGDTVLAELMLYRSKEYPAAWDYLCGFRGRECQPGPADDGLRVVLKRHLLVEEAGDGQWKLRVPLMSRWLRERT